MFFSGVRHHLALLCLAFWRCYPKAKGGHGRVGLIFITLRKPPHFTGELAGSLRGTTMIHSMTIQARI